MHNVAKLTKFKRAERDALLRDPRYLQLLDGTVERVSECNARAVADHSRAPSPSPDPDPDH